MHKRPPTPLPRALAGSGRVKFRGCVVTVAAPWREFLHVDFPFPLPHGVAVMPCLHAQHEIFSLADVGIHFTTAPETVIERCRDNLNAGFRPVLVTGQRGLTVGEAFADNANLGERIDVFEIEQFIALNLHELGRFGADGRRIAVADLVDRYNESNGLTRPISWSSISDIGGWRRVGR